MITQQVIDELGIKVNSILGEFTTALDAVKELKEQENQDTAKREELHRIERQLLEQHRSLAQQKEALQTEQLQLSSEVEKLSRRRIIIGKQEETIDQQKKELVQDRIDLVKQQEEVAAANAKVQSRQSIIDKAELLLKQIEEREAEVQKQITIDRERKLTLDKREQKIQAQEARIAKYFPDE